MNIDMEMNGNKMTLVIDLDKEIEFSRSGKNIIIASTKGNRKIPGWPGYRIGLNVYKDRNPPDGLKKWPDTDLVMGSGIIEDVNKALYG